MIKEKNIFNASAPHTANGDAIDDSDLSRMTVEIRKERFNISTSLIRLSRPSGGYAKRWIEFRIEDGLEAICDPRYCESSRNLLGILARFTSKRTSACVELAQFIQREHGLFRS